MINLLKKNFRRARLDKFFFDRHFFFLLLGKFIKDGKKEKGRKAFFRALIKLKIEEGYSINEMISRVFGRLMPTLGLKSQFSSGINYLLPSMISEKKARTLALMWFSRAVKMQPDSKLHRRIYWEFKLLMEGSGLSVGYKKEHYNLVRKNKILLYRFKKRRK